MMVRKQVLRSPEGVTPRWWAWGRGDREQRESCDAAVLCSGSNQRLASDSRGKQRGVGRSWGDAADPRPYRIWEGFSSIRKSLRRAVI